MLKKFFKSLVNLINFYKIDENKKEYVFYSESKFYREHFVDLIDNFIKLGQKNIIFVTSDKDDYDFFKDKLKCFYIENFFILSLFFKTLNCKFMIMTLTDLGNHLQKSKNCKNYVYFFHALASTHEIYTNTAFKNYDIILTNGEYQTKELKSAEDKLNFPKKKIVNTGYFFLDHINNKAQLENKEKFNILFAPSWNYNKNNLFDDHSTNIISKLLSNNFIVNLRPHPEHYKRSANTINQINKMFLNNNNFFIDQNKSNLRSLEKAEILITDNSSIVIEFVLIFRRPIIYVDYKEKMHNEDRSKIPITTIDEDFKKIFGNVININNLEQLPELCKNLISKNDISDDLVDTFTNKYLSNVGVSANFAANYLIKK